MAKASDKLKELLADPFACGVYYFASTEEALLRQATQQVKTALRAAGDDEITRIDGPVPSLDELVSAAGAISFLGTKRVVELREITPSAMKDKDVEDLAGLFSDLANAVLVVSCLYKDKKAAQNKKAKRLMDAAAQAGFAQELAKPTRADNLKYLHQLAAEQGARFAPGAAEALLERAGEDRFLLQSEVAKLAAFAGYGEIGAALVEERAVHNVEADVFALVRLITGGRKAAAYQKLDELLALRHEPVAIAAALSGSYVDMYRVRVGTQAKRTVPAIFKELGYYGNDYRLKKAQESSAAYTMDHLRECILSLAQLDASLKSSAVSDKGVLLAAAMGQLMLLRNTR